MTSVSKVEVVKFKGYELHITPWDYYLDEASGKWVSVDYNVTIVKGSSSQRCNDSLAPTTVKFRGGPVFEFTGDGFYECTLKVSVTKKFISLTWVSTETGTIINKVKYYNWVFEA